MDGLGRRLTLGVALAALIVALLRVGLARADREQGAPREAATPAPPAVEPGPAVPRGLALLVYVATREDELPARVAPVVRIAADASVAVRRAAPPPLGPELADAVWPAAGIVLRTADLDALDGRERALLLEVLRSFGVGHRFDAALVRVGERGELAGAAALRRWLR
ncbi:MAG: hypothetical protein IPM29_16120 [Planctomycetes bacterium]|nr:hypothetical protein [Planctomycetota bacterium]